MSIGHEDPGAQKKRRGLARVAHAAAWNAVESPVDCGNPLVLHGPVGTGKTHMASALCALACERRLEARFFTANPNAAERLEKMREGNRSLNLSNAVALVLFP